MTQQIEQDGQIHEFPDEATPEMIAEALGVSYTPDKGVGSIGGFKGFEDDQQQPNKPSTLRDMMMAHLTGGGLIPKNQSELYSLGSKINQTKDFLSKPANWRDMGLGFANETANLPADALNIPIKLGNAVNSLAGKEYSIQAPEIPRFDFAPKNKAAEIGGMGAYAIPAGDVAKGAKLGGELFGGIGAKAASPLTSRLEHMFKTLVTPLKERETMESVRKGHDVLRKEAVSGFKQVSNIAKDRNIGEIKLPPELLKQVKAQLPETVSINKLIERAGNGEYEALHKLQSSLGKRGSKKMTAPETYDEGEMMLDTRKEMNKFIEKKFKELGHPDLAKKLRESRRQYKQLQDTYYSHPTVAKMVNPKTRKKPPNISNLFSEESVQMDKLKAAHPEVSNLAQLYQDKKRYKKMLGGGVGGLAGGIALDQLYNRVLK